MQSNFYKHHIHSHIVSLTKYKFLLSSWISAYWLPKHKEFYAIIYSVWYPKQNSITNNRDEKGLMIQFIISKK